MPHEIRTNKNGVQRVTKYTSVLAQIKECLDTPEDEWLPPVTPAMQLAQDHVRDALRGRKGKQIRCRLDIIDRVDGKAVQRNEHSGPDGGPIQVEDVRSTLDAKLAQLALRTGQAGVPGQPNAGGDETPPDGLAIPGEAESATT